MYVYHTEIVNRLLNCMNGRYRLYYSKYVEDLNCNSFNDMNYVISRYVGDMNYFMGDMFMI